MGRRAGGPPHLHSHCFLLPGFPLKCWKFSLLFSTGIHNACTSDPFHEFTQYKMGGLRVVAVVAFVAISQDLAGGLYLSI